MAVKSALRTFTLLSSLYRTGGKTYKRGDTVKSEKDLVKKYGPDKFAYGDVSQPNRSLGDDGLGKLDAKKLREFAVGEEIDVEGVADEELLAHVRRSLYGL